jgi:predicted GNAT superfamily acetyltransferase
MTPGAPAAASVTFRSFRDDADYEACWELQGEIWGELRDRVSPALMRVSQHVGGVAAGAFDGGGALLGFVWGLSGFRHGRPAHWSHVLGVRPGLRDLGLGRRLKLFQRRLLLPRGVEGVWWTFDPLEARNAHLNLSRLGVEVESYVLDYYGSGASSPLHRGLGTDRFIVVWRLTSARAMAALAGRPPEDLTPFAAAPVAGSHLDAAGLPQPLEDAEPPPPGPLRIEVPADVQALKAAHPEAAARWRAVTRRLFRTCLGRGQAVRAFYREPASGRCFYGVS